jgi:hypothetical protein
VWGGGWQATLASQARRDRYAANEVAQTYRMQNEAAEAARSDQCDMAAAGASAGASAEAFYFILFGGGGGVAGSLWPRMGAGGNHGIDTDRGHVGVSQSGLRPIDLMLSARVVSGRPRESASTRRSCRCLSIHL